MTVPPDLLRRLVALPLLIGAASVFLSTPATATPPGVPTEPEARTMLAGLRLAPEGSMSGYSRDEFPHWDTVSGDCTVREVVLQRDGSDVATDSSCYPVSGRWYSPYEGGTYVAASDVDIDHVVPLAEAWRSGANEWSDDRRNAFANDLRGPQLIAVRDTVNQTKGDQSPDQWKPPRTAYWCTYARMWIDTKSYWELSITSGERSTLSSMLDRC